jgi:hypothetical protein
VPVGAECLGTGSDEDISEQVHPCLQALNAWEPEVTKLPKSEQVHLFLQALNAWEPEVTKIRTYIRAKPLCLQAMNAWEPEVTKTYPSKSIRACRR